MVTGLAFPQPFALAMLPAGRWDDLLSAEARRAFTDDLAAHVAAVNARLDPHERLDFVAVVPEQWTVESGFLTPTLKLKRNVTEKYYAPFFDRWTQARATVVWHEG